jgi:ubiquinone/menaquinone biosynthesis C-methylase UbiE
MSERTSQEYIPGMGKHYLLPLYDVVHHLFGLRPIHQEMITLAGLRDGLRVLDVGCGTGNLLRSTGKRWPKVELSGMDPDPKALARARRKTRRAGLDVRLDRGFAQEMPFPDDSFDRVFSSLMLHHLDPPVKEGTLAEVHRVLRPGGVLVLADFDGHGQGHGHGQDGHGHGQGHRHGFGPFRRRMRTSRRLAENSGIPAMITAAGLVPDAPAAFTLRRIGTVSVVRATKG